MEDLKIIEGYITRVDFTFKCEACGSKMPYDLRHQDLLELKDQIFRYECGNWPEDCRHVNEFKIEFNLKRII